MNARGQRRPLGVKLRLAAIGGIAAAAAVLGPADVGGFGTVDDFDGQKNEHERITRAALACTAGVPSDGTCFEPATLDQLAGRGAGAIPPSAPTT